MEYVPNDNYLQRYGSAVVDEDFFPVQRASFSAYPEVNHQVGKYFSPSIGERSNLLTEHRRDFSSSDESEELEEISEDIDVTSFSSSDESTERAHAKAQKAEGSPKPAWTSLEREPSIREVVRECNGDVVQFLHKVLLIGARAGLHANVRDVRNGHCRVEWEPSPSSGSIVDRYSLTYEAQDVTSGTNIRWVNPSLIGSETQSNHFVHSIPRTSTVMSAVSPRTPSQQPRSLSPSTQNRSVKTATPRAKNEDNHNARRDSLDLQIEGKGVQLQRPHRSQLNIAPPARATNSGLRAPPVARMGGGFAFRRRS